MEIYSERKRLEKIVTSYLPHLYTEDPDVPEAETDKQKADPYYGKKPAERAHSSYSVLKRTGRTSSYSSKHFPSFNGQQVDPRIRPCIIPEEGYLFFSVDYSGMELGSTAQFCLNTFGYSVMSEKINAGVDLHAYLGAQIAFELDPEFREGVMEYVTNDESSRDTAHKVFMSTKGSKAACWSDSFRSTFKATHPEEEEEPTWGDFFKHYRKFAKPTGLGFPGGLGAGTFVSYAKSSYGVTVDLDTAKLLRQVWFDTYP
jgi:hypothetical protein